MKKQELTFEIDRRSVTEGEVVEIRWQCEGAERVHLTIDNGIRVSDIPLENNGTKRFRLNRSKGRTRLTLGATIMGREHRKSHRVRVKKMPVVRAETLDHRGRPLNALKRTWQNIMTKCHTWHSRTRLAMGMLPERKQVALRVLGIISMVLLLSLFWPRLYGLGMVAVMVYLGVVLLRR